MIASQQIKKALVAGHICLDLIPQLPEGGDADFVPGRLLPVGQAVTSTGGAVPNTGLALHRLGVPVRLAGKIGADLFGMEISRLVARELGTEDTGLIRTPGCDSSYSIVLNPPGRDRMFLHCAGANDDFGPEDLPAAELARADLMHFGYPPLMRRMYEHGGRELVALLRKAKDAGVGVTLDMARTDRSSPAGQADWAAILQAALPQVDCFFPSIDELIFMLDAPRFSAFEAASAGGVPAGGLDLPYVRALAGRLLAMGVGMAVLKLGGAGLYVRVSEDAQRLERMGRLTFPGLSAWAGYERYAPCYNVHFAGGTGAGDCTIAGFLAGMLRGLGPDQTVDCALGTGAFNVEVPDALSGIPDWERLQRRIASGWERRMPELAGAS